MKALKDFFEVFFIIVGLIAIGVFISGAAVIISNTAVGWTNVEICADCNFFRGCLYPDICPRCGSHNIVKGRSRFVLYKWIIKFPNGTRKTVTLYDWFKTELDYIEGGNK